jgi:phosphoribosylanthranilate isomerase
VELALAMKKQLHSDIKAVGVFVNEEPKTISEIAKRGIIDLIQLHGSENEAYIKEIKALTHKPVIKAIPVQEKEDIQAWENSTADFLLLDDKNAGSGNTFDWNLIGEVEKPFFFAGGLNPKNVAEAIQIGKPFAVDVSSGVETLGVKDPNKIKEFIRNAREGGMQ